MHSLLPAKLSFFFRGVSRTLHNMAKELFTEGKFSYRILTPAHRDAAHAVLARAFCTEPACSDVAEIKPEMKTEYIDWLEFIDYWMEHCSTNGLSVVALDKDNCRVAGVFIVRDLLGGNSIDFLPAPRILFRQ